MLIVKDTEKIDDPDVVGELLRGYSFVPDEFRGTYGCYSTFKLQPEFDPVDPPEWVVKKLVGSIPTTPEDLKWRSVEDWNREKKNICSYYSKKNNLFVFWLWDGDGVLIFQEGNRIVINTDCKKSYNWEFLDVKET